MTVELHFFIGYASVLFAGFRLAFSYQLYKSLAQVCEQLFNMRCCLIGRRDT